MNGRPNTTAREWMRPPSTTVGPTESCSAAIRRMDETGVRGLPVLADDRLVGVVTYNDIRKRVPRQNGDPAGLVGEPFLLDHVKVSGVMALHPWPADPSTPIEEIAERMAREQLDFLPVLEDDHLVGVLDFRDILAALMTLLRTEPRPGGSSVKVQEYMKTHVVTIKPLDTAMHARELMEEHRIHQLPVVEGRELVGIVTDRDVRDAFPGVFDAIKSKKARSAPLGNPDRIPVEEIMSSGVRSVTPDTDVIDATRILREERIGAVPVVRDRKLVGILARSDVLDCFLALLAERADSTAAAS